MIRCGLQEKIPNEINAKFWEWCGREETTPAGLTNCICYGLYSAPLS
jgi:hypothetical protein